MHGNDVFVRKRRDDLRLVPEHGDEFRHERQLAAEHLHGEKLFQRRVLGEIDRSRGAEAENRNDFVVADSVSGLKNFLFLAHAESGTRVNARGNALPSFVKKERNYSTSSTTCTSAVACSGTPPSATAARACFPFSPKTARKSSDAPLMTFGASAKPSGA